MKFEEMRKVFEEPITGHIRCEVYCTIPYSGHTLSEYRDGAYYRTLCTIEDIRKLMAVVEAALLAPVREAWNQDRCNKAEYEEWDAAVDALNAALEALEK